MAPIRDEMYFSWQDNEQAIAQKLAAYFFSYHTQLACGYLRVYSNPWLRHMQIVDKWSNIARYAEFSNLEDQATVYNEKPIRIEWLQSKGVICPCCQTVHHKFYPASIISGTKTFNSQYAEEDLNLEVEEEICSDCTFWMNRVSLAEDPNSIIINGHAFYREIAQNRDVMPAITMKVLKNKTVEVMSLWDNGIIPENLREYLPDNAYKVQK